RGPRPPWRSRLARCGGALMAAALLSGGMAACEPPTGRSVDLRVLVVSTGDRSTDPGLELMARTMDQIGVPYDGVDSTPTELTDATLATGDRGHYNGIILTQADLFTPAGSGFSPAEWQ